MGVRLADDHLDVASLTAAMVQGQHGNLLFRLQGSHQIHQAFDSLHGLSSEGQQDILHLLLALEKACRAHMDSSPVAVGAEGVSMSARTAVSTKMMMLIAHERGALTPQVPPSHHLKTLPRSAGRSCLHHLLDRARLTHAVLLLVQAASWPY